MHYNLLYYGINTSYCTSSNNNINKKDGYLRTILSYRRPDIFTVNEISKSPAIHQHLLDQVLNTGGILYYRKADFLSGTESDIVNMLYYNSNKLVLKKHALAQSFIRDVDVYELYYRSGDLESGDTAFIICIVGHLKAGTGTTNKNYREVMAENTMDYLNAYDDDANYLLMGDFNVYSASEAAYQEFLFHSNPSLRFIDPIDSYGDWNNNYNFRYVHTQSTHENSNGCAAGGGIDDRFDFILTSKSVRDGSQNVKYIPDTYWAIGQDGEHFNTSINASPTNTSVPFDVLSALYRNSDHLPITLDLEIDKILGIENLNKLEQAEIKYRNPSSEILSLNLLMNYNTTLDIEICDMFGRVLISENERVTQGRNEISIPLSYLKKGNYLLRFTDSGKNRVVKKLVII